jgi:hypothetical protein
MIERFVFSDRTRCQEYIPKNVVMEVLSCLARDISFDLDRWLLTAQGRTGFHVGDEIGDDIYDYFWGIWYRSASAVLSL